MQATITSLSCCRLRLYNCFDHNVCCFIIQFSFALQVQWTRPRSFGRFWFWRRNHFVVSKEVFRVSGNPRVYSSRQCHSSFFTNYQHSSYLLLHQRGNIDRNIWQRGRQSACLCGTFWSSIECIEQTSSVYLRSLLLLPRLLGRVSDLRMSVRSRGVGDWHRLRLPFGGRSDGRVFLAGLQDSDLETEDILFVWSGRPPVSGSCGCCRGRRRAGRRRRGRRGPSPSVKRWFGGRGVPLAPAD